MEQKHIPLSKDVLQNINARIKELTEMIATSESGYTVCPVVEWQNKELRRLRRQRDGNIHNDN